MYIPTTQRPSNHFNGSWLNHDRVFTSTCIFSVFVLANLAANIVATAMFKEHEVGDDKQKLFELSFAGVTGVIFLIKSLAHRPLELSCAREAWLPSGSIKAQESEEQDPEANRRPLAEAIATPNPQAP